MIHPLSSSVCTYGPEMNTTSRPSPLDACSLPTTSSLFTWSSRSVTSTPVSFSKSSIRPSGVYAAQFETTSSWSSSGTAGAVLVAAAGLLSLSLLEQAVAAKATIANARTGLVMRCIDAFPSDDWRGRYAHAVTRSTQVTPHV